MYESSVAMRTGGLRAALCILGLVAAGGGPVVRGADPAPIEAPQSPNSLSSAAQELRDIKAGAAASNNAVGPSSSPILVPSLPAGGESMPPLMLPSSGASGSSLQEPSANWLIDAMSEQRRSRSSASDSDVRERVRGAQSPVRRFTKPRDDSANGASGEHRASRGFVGRLDEATGLDSVERTPASTPNPLAPYLSSWLAPREYARLQSALDRPAEIVSPVSAAPSPGNLEVGVVALPGRNQLPRMPASIGYKPLENPYLQAMLPSAVPGRPSSASPSAPVVARPLSPKVEDLPPQAPPQSAIPPFVKPLSEERYFKPLKRF